MLHKELIDGTEWVYTKSGNGPTVIFLHGLAAGASTWDRAESSLANEFTCVSVNLPGYSLDVDGERIHTFTELASGLQSLVARVATEPVSLVGHSLGGSLALMCAEMGETSIAKVVLAAPAGFGTEIGRVVSILAGHAGSVALKLLHTKGISIALSAAVQYQQIRNPSFESTPAAQAYEALSRLRTAAARKQLRATAAAALEARASLTMPESFKPETSSLPACIIWGSRDTVFPNGHAAIAASKFETARVEIIEGAGHAPHRTHSAEFNAVLASFLST